MDKWMRNNSSTISPPRALVDLERFLVYNVIISTQTLTLSRHKVYYVTLSTLYFLGYNEKVGRHLGYLQLGVMPARYDIVIVIMIVIMMMIHLLVLYFVQPLNYGDVTKVYTLIK
jgi:hypothetical protein